MNNTCIATTYRLLLGGAMAVTTVTARAQLPLSIEELLVQDSVLKVSTQASGFQAYEPTLALIATAPGQPPRAGLGRRQLLGQRQSVALRYGLRPRIELNATATQSSLRWREPGAAGGRLTRENYSLAASWLALPEGRWPALLIDAGVDLLQRERFASTASASFAAYRVGLTVYRALDPVVLSLAARYRHQPSHRDFVSTERGRWWLAPQVNFSVNPQVTLIGGLTVSGGTDRDVRAPQLLDEGLSSALRLGLGYAPGKRNTLFVNADFSTAGGESSGLSVEWLHQF